jgi:Rrf2 family nitric oxide-sensitive transcriptional repressor
MRLTVHTDYALRVLIFAAVEPAALCTIERISVAFGISKNHLMKVVQRLGELGFVETIRGRGGGLRLARPAREIIIGDVVRRMEDDLAQAECFRPRDNACPITAACGLKHALGEALNAYLAVLDKCSVADIARKRTALARLLDLEHAS